MHPTETVCPPVSRRHFLKTASLAAASASVLPAVGAAEDKPITLGFVGCAHIHTPGFIDLLKRRKDVRVKCVWDHDAGRAAKRATQLGAKVVADAAEVCSDPEIAAVIICSETNRHPALVQAAARAGKHMFVEKPLGFSAKESYDMARAIQQAQVRFNTGYFMRGDRAHLFLKEQIPQGIFGKITRVRGSNCHSGSLGGWFDTEWRWMADPKIAGVGGFGDLGTHSLDLMMWLLGDVEAVSAQVRVVTGRYGDCDETGEALLRFKSGVLGTLAAGWVDVDNPVSLLISGTEGHAVIMNGELYLKAKSLPGADGKEPWTKLPPARPAPLSLFVDAVAGQKDLPLVTPSEAAARVSVMEAMYQSAKDQKWVTPA